MRVGIEGKVLSPHAGGIGRYAVALLTSLLRLRRSLDRQAEFVVFTGPQTSRAVMERLAGECRECYSGVRSSLVRCLISLPSGIARERIDVFHGLDHVGIPLIHRRGRCLVTVHDVIPLIHPEWFSPKHRWVVRAAIGRVLRRADLVIVPSESVRGDVLERMPHGDDRVVVVPEGCEERFGPEQDPEESRRIRSKYRLPASYVLAVGRIEPRKNLSVLVQAFARLDRPDLTLVLAGAPGWRSREVFDTAAESGLGDRVRFTGFVDDRDLPELYRGAALFAFPSLCEGFGLPVLEAMGCGTPVMASNASSIPEVAGDAALLVDPRSPDELADSMRRVLDDEDLRRTLREKGLRRAAGSSWETAARRTLDLYARVNG